jgi:ribosomal 30S subunit maturation factor RimM
VETFLNIDDQPSLLRIESSKEHKELSIPSFLDVIREVTMDEKYVGIAMAEIDWKMP